MSTLPLTPQQAQHLNDRGASLLCLDVPCKTFFGIDYLTFEVGPKFKGVKMVPSGAHFIHTSIQDDGRMGFFIWLKSKQTEVYQWDEQIKCLTPFADKEQAERLCIAVRKGEFDVNLGSYPLQTYAKWKKLSCHIDEAVIRKLGPNTGVIWSTYSELNHVQQNEEQNENENETKESDLHKNYVAAKAKFEHYHPKYTKITQIKNMKDLTPSQRTALQMDRSTILYGILERHFKTNELSLLGEMQYAFICLLVGQSVQGLNHWKDIVDLLSNCCEAVQQKQSFYEQFVQSLLSQFQELPADFFRDELTNENFLNQSLQSFLEICNESKLNKDLNKQIQMLTKILSQRFDKTFDLETDGPQVVVL